LFCRDLEKIALKFSLFFWLDPKEPKNQDAAKLQPCRWQAGALSRTLARCCVSLSRRSQKSFMVK
jgi:hypothetical protein